MTFTRSAVRDGGLRSDTARMWEDDLAVVRRGYDAFNAKDADAYIAVCHPDVRFSPMVAGVEGGYHGHAGIRAWLAQMSETFSDSTVAIESIDVVEGAVIVSAVFHGLGRSSEAETTQPLVHAVDVRDGLVRWFAAYRDREEAMAGIRSRDATPPQDR